MPHIIIKMLPGRTDQQKKRLADEIVKDVTSIMNCGEESVSVAFEDIKQHDWTEKVYKPDIQGHWDRLYKKPGYKPF